MLPDYRCASLYTKNDFQTTETNQINLNFHVFVHKGLLSGKSRKPTTNNLLFNKLWAFLMESGNWRATVDTTCFQRWVSCIGLFQTQLHWSSAFLNHKVNCAKKCFLPRCTEPPIQEKSLRSRALYVISSHYNHSCWSRFFPSKVNKHMHLSFSDEELSHELYHWPIVTISLTTCFLWMTVASPSIHLLYSCTTARADISSACNHWTRHLLSRWSWHGDA